MVDIPCIDFMAIMAADNWELSLALMLVTATEGNLAAGDTSVDTGGEFKNGRNDPLHTGFRRSEKQGCFLCRDADLRR
jgi:hypothetical protein